jgi:hypothetical protein
MPELINDGSGKWDELANETDIAAGTYYYPDEDGLSMDGQDDLSLGYVLSGGVTMTVWAHQDSSSEESPTWHDITRSGYDTVNNATGAASYVNLSGILDFDNLNVMKFRIKIVTSDGTNTVVIKSRRKSIDK